MRPSHLCPACGTDLARLRAQREPHYGFAIVRCLRCNRVAVRRDRIPTRRRARHAWRAATTLAGRLALGLVIGAALVRLFLSAPMFLDWRDWGWWSLITIVPFTTGVGLFLGIWIEIALQHWRRNTVALVIPALVLAIMLWTVLSDDLDDPRVLALAPMVVAAIPLGATAERRLGRSRRVLRWRLRTRRRRRDRRRYRR